MPSILQSALPIDANSISPYVKVTFAVNNQTITVGNISTPGNMADWFKGKAAIKSFEFAASNANTCEMEIVDEEGGSFAAFVANLTDDLDKFKDSKSVSEDYMATIEWGWRISNCKVGTFMPPPAKIYTFPLKMSAEFGQGKVKYKITFMDYMQVSFATRENMIFGSDSNPILVTDSIEKLCRDKVPALNVEYWDKNGNLVPDRLKFKSAGKLDPRSTFNTDNQNKLSTIVKWVKQFVTENDRGVTFSWNHQKKEPTLMIVEGNGLEWDTNDCSRIEKAPLVAKFLVNGGKLSNVISFTPTFEWPAFWAEAGKGAPSGTGSVDQIQKTPICNWSPEQVGQQKAGSDSKAQWDNVPPKRLKQEEIKTQKAYTLANRSYLGNPITAQLKIQGTTEEWAWHPLLVQGKRVSVNVINPFFRQTKDEGADWTAEPRLNSILTNDYWMIMGISHSIREGSFVTTLTLRLNPPFGPNTGAAQVWHQASQ